ncbi:MAG: DUF11 domain-containing protein [Clostridia bacterium]|nr:DUF11 domain-containing protein [Clostridia bacterium]
MATFYNQATLSYNGISTTSNIVSGEFLDTVTATKTAVGDTYRVGDSVTYIISLTNNGADDLTGLTVTDDLGSYTFNGQTLTPLTYNAGTLRYYVSGVLQPEPAITAVSPLTVTGITVPTGGNSMIVYETTVNEFAPPETGGTITNTAVTAEAEKAVGASASETITVEDGAVLDITKSISPLTVSDNDTLTYTFVIRNTGSTAAAQTDDVTLTDTFDPALTGLTVTYNGTPWTEGADYTYAGGVFTTTAGGITVPAAEYSQDPLTGAWAVTPGIATIVVSGTV